MRLWPNPTASVAPAVDYLVAVDPAQGGLDWTALAVIERLEPLDGGPAHYLCIHLERWRDRRTARIPERIGVIEKQLAERELEREFARRGRVSEFAARPPIRLLMDITGIGGFGSDPLRQGGFDPIGVLIHGGSAVSRGEGGVYRVPKRDLASAISVCLDQGRLTIVESLADASVLRAELENFRVRVSLSGHDSYEAAPGEEWRSGSHDDLVLAVGIGVWLGEVQRLPTLDPFLARAFVGLPGS